MPRMIEQATVKLPHTDRDTNPPVSIHLVHLSSCFVPPFTVASLATSITSCPETRPTPVSIPAAGTRPSYIPKAARGESSRKAVPGSSSNSVRSRTGSFPRSLWGLGGALAQLPEKLLVGLGVLPEPLALRVNQGPKLAQSLSRPPARSRRRCYPARVTGATGERGSWYLHLRSCGE